MRTLLAAVLFSFGANTLALAAGDIKCPPGTNASGEETPDVDEAWCEKMYQGRTVMHGPYRAWWPNGRLGTSGQYINGEAVGKWTGWYPNGQRQGYEWFEKGKVVKARYWDLYGNPTDARPNSTAESDARKNGARGSP